MEAKAIKLWVLTLLLLYTTHMSNNAISYL